MLIDVRAACARLSISRTTLYRLTAAGSVQAVKIGRRTLFRPADLDRLAETGASTRAERELA